MVETMEVREYFSVEVPDKPGEGARMLAQLKEAGVNLLAFSGFPAGRRAQLDFVPADGKAFRAAARKAKWRLGQAKKVFLVTGQDRIGVAANVLGKLAASKINVTASQAVAAGAGQFGMILWVKPPDLRRAIKALGLGNAAPAPSAAQAPIEPPTIGTPH